jgi:hypothetical protein
VTALWPCAVTHCVCVYYCRTYYKAACGGEGDTEAPETFTKTCCFSRFASLSGTRGNRRQRRPFAALVPGARCELTPPARPPTARCIPRPQQPAKFTKILAVRRDSTVHSIHTHTIDLGAVLEILKTMAGARFPIFPLFLNFLVELF